MSSDEMFTVVTSKARKKHAFQQTKPNKSKEKVIQPCHSYVWRQEFVETLFWNHVQDCLFKLKIQPLTIGIKNECEQLKDNNMECNDVSETTTNIAITIDSNCSRADSIQVSHLVCYGLGNFTLSYISKHQLSLLIALKNYFNLSPESCVVYDPIFTTEEQTLLHDYGLTYCKSNEEGKRSVAEGSKGTLFFMPHCPKELYNNLLWANWSLERLSRITIIGNSFQSMALSVPSRILKSEYHYISTILPYTCATELRNIYEPDDVFNDLAVHRFDAHNIPRDLLRQQPAPVYSTTSELVTETS